MLKLKKVKNYRDLSYLNNDKINIKPNLLIRSGHLHKLNKKSMTVSYNYGDKQMVKHFHLHLLPNMDDKPTHTVDEMYESIID